MKREINLKPARHNGGQAIGKHYLETGIEALRNLELAAGSRSIMALRSRLNLANICFAFV